MAAHSQDSKPKQRVITKIFTCSYIKDLERAAWMRRSVRRFLRTRCEHVMAVPKQDLSAFKVKLGHDPDLRLVTQDEAVASFLYPDKLFKAVEAIVPSQTWRFERHAGRPGWIIQQIAKLNSVRWVANGAVVYVDSDVIFTRPFGPEDFGITDGVRSLIRITPKDEASRHRDHLNRARRILGAPPGPTEHHYLSNPAVWYADWIRALQDHIAKVAGKDWQRALFEARHLSEFTIYGAFVEDVLRPKSLNIIDQPLHSGAWEKSALEDLRRQFADPSQPFKPGLAMVIQSNIGIPVRQYEDILEAIVGKPNDGS